MAPGAWDELLAGDELPDRLAADAWQETDEAHPSGTGTPCYRVVFKTLRVAAQDAELAWPNLRVRFRSGAVSRGGFKVNGSVPSREPGLSVLPEFGRWRQDGDAIKYEPVGRVDPHLQGWADKTPPLFFVECLLDTEAAAPQDVLEEGRRGLSSIVTLVDLSLGRRVLGALLAEEAGERFDDGHFNRHVGTEQFCWEPQLDVVGLSHEDIRRWAGAVVNGWMDRPQRDRLLFGLASRWYQEARSQSTRAMAFLQYWFAVEVLALPDTTNIGALRRLVADATGNDERDWGEFVGRLFGLRGALVHGDTDDVTVAQLGAVRALAELVLATFLSLGISRQLGKLREAKSELFAQIAD